MWAFASRITWIRVCYVPWCIRALFLCRLGVTGAGLTSRVIDLDVDIGADAVDYKYVPEPLTVDTRTVLTRVQCHCQPGVSLRSGDGDAETRGHCERDSRRVGLPQNKRRTISGNKQYVITHFTRVRRT